MKSSSNRASSRYLITLHSSCHWLPRYVASHGPNIYGCKVFFVVGEKLNDHWKGPT